MYSCDVKYMYNWGYANELHATRTLLIGAWVMGVWFANQSSHCPWVVQGSGEKHCVWVVVMVVGGGCKVQVKMFTRVGVWSMEKPMLLQNEISKEGCHCRRVGDVFLPTFCKLKKVRPTEQGSVGVHRTAARCAHPG